MRWTEIYAENFMAFPKLKLNLDKRGLVLIEGVNLSSNKFQSNGAAKTSIIESLVYALYDTTTKGLKADEIIHRQAGKNTVVILKGYKGDDLYRIERYRKHSKHKNKVKVFVNDEDITAKSTADTNALIQELVGVDYLTFTNSILFSQSNALGKFSTSSDKEKKVILENLVNLQIYSDAQTIAKEKVKAKEQQIEAKKREEEKMQWELTQVDNLEQQDKQRYESTKQAIEQEEANFESTKEAMNKHINDNQHNVTTWINEVEKLKEEQEKLTANSDNPYAQEVTDLTNQINDVKSQQQQLTYQQNDIVKRYKQLGLNTHCPVCGNELDTEHRDKEQAELREQLKQVLTQLNPLAPQLERLQEQQNTVYAQYQEVKTKQDNIVAVHRDFTNKITYTNGLLQQYHNTLESYKSKLSSITSTLNRLRSFPEPSSRESDRLGIRDRINANKQAVASLQKELNILEDTVKIFSNSGVKSHVLDLITPFLNERANKYLGMLAGTDMELEFSTQTRKKDGEMSEKFDVKLTNAVGGESYKANSEGEKKRADLSIALALQDLVLERSESKFNITMYDEVFDSLDSVGAENVVHMLKEKQKEIDTILVITHSEHLKSLFDQTITVTKNREGISTITEGENIT